MVRSETWLLMGLMGLICVLPVWMNTESKRCIALRAIDAQLNITLRRRYLRHNFPINYTIQVHYEEVFRLRNITRLRTGEDPLNEADLQYLWLMVAQAGIKKILQILPERHPTRRRYLTDLEELFRTYEGAFKSMPSEQLNEILENIGSRINEQESRWVTPKSLLDNCYRTMHCLFKECFSTDLDYCDILHWRKRNVTTPQPT